MNNKIKKIILSIEKRVSVKLTKIKLFADEVGFALSTEYLSFFAFSNGMEGAVGKEGYIHIWSYEDIIENNRVYNVRKDRLYIATDGGDCAYFFNKNGEIFEISLSDPDGFPVLKVATSFFSFIIKLSKDEI